MYLVEAEFTDEVIAQYGLCKSDFFTKPLPLLNTSM